MDPRTRRCSHLLRKTGCFLWNAGLKSYCPKQKKSYFPFTLARSKDPHWGSFIRAPAGPRTFPLLQHIQSPPSVWSSDFLFLRISNPDQYMNSPLLSFPLHWIPPPYPAPSSPVARRWVKTNIPQNAVMKTVWKWVK